VRDRLNSNLQPDRVSRSADGSRSPAHRRQGCRA